MRVHHLAIAVTDLDAALSFYRDALGLHLERVEDVPSEGVRVAFLPIGGPGDANRSEIELLQPIRNDTGVTKWLAKHGPGMHHICLAVDDIEATLARLSQRGVELINPRPVARDDGTRYAFIHPRSTFGVLIELYQVAQPA